MPARIFLTDMRVYAEKAMELVGDRTGAELAADDVRFLAVQRCVEIVGEAANQVSREHQKLLGDIPFSEAIATRHRLVHGYRTLSADIVASTVREDFPPLIAAVRTALAAPLPDD